MQSCPVLSRDAWAVLKTKALNIISMRLGRMGCNKVVGAAELPALDDGLGLCTPDDKKQIEDEQEARTIPRTVFATCWWI